MRSVEAAGRVAADPGTVWQELVDVGSWRDWRSGVDRVDGRVAVGAMVTVHAPVHRGRGVRMRVTELRPGAVMRWRGGLPLGLFTVERTFRLDGQPDGTTGVTVQEEYSGPLAPVLVSRVLPDMTSSFRTFVGGLGERVQKRADRRG